MIGLISCSVFLFFEKLHAATHRILILLKFFWIRPKILLNLHLGQRESSKFMHVL